MRALPQLAFATALLLPGLAFSRSQPEAARPPEPPRAEAAHPRGAALFEGACSACHGEGAVRILQGRPRLDRSAVLQQPDPRGALKIVLDGVKPPIGRSGPYMPAFADTFRDDDLAELLAYLRARFSDRPAWRGLAGAVRTARAAG